MYYYKLYLQSVINYGLVSRRWWHWCTTTIICFCDKRLINGEYKQYTYKLKILPESSSALFNSGGTGICISNNDGILFLSLLELELFSTEGFGSSSKLFYKINNKPHNSYLKISNWLIIYKS